MHIFKNSRQIVMSALNYTAFCTFVVLSCSQHIHRHCIMYLTLNNNSNNRKWLIVIVDCSHFNNLVCSFVLWNWISFSFTVVWIALFPSTYIWVLNNNNNTCQYWLLVNVSQAQCWHRKTLFTAFCVCKIRTWGQVVKYWYLKRRIYWPVSLFLSQFVFVLEWKWHT